MTQADSVHSTPPINTSPEELTARLAKEARKRQRALARLHKLRQKAADEIDRLLEFLDASDIDPDLEPTLGFMNGPAEMDECETPEDDEPSLASLDGAANQTKWADGSMSDAEMDNSDDEPSIGSLSSHGPGDQSEWGRPCKGVMDAEDEHDGTEPTEDDEPSLANTPREDAFGVMKSGSDMEADHDGREPAVRPSEKTIKKVKANFRRFRHRSHNRDGKHIESEHGFAGGKRLRNLSDKQIEIVGPNLDRYKVTLL